MHIVDDDDTELSPRSHNECLCLHCGRKSYGSVPPTEEYCNFCIDNYIEKLQAENKQLEKNAEKYLKVLERNRDIADFLDQINNTPRAKP